MRKKNFNFWQWAGRTSNTIVDVFMASHTIHKFILENATTKTTNCLAYYLLLFPPTDLFWRLIIIEPEEIFFSIHTYLDAKFFKYAYIWILKRYSSIKCIAVNAPAPALASAPYAFTKKTCLVGGEAGRFVVQWSRRAVMIEMSGWMHDFDMCIQSWWIAVSFAVILQLHTRLNFVRKQYFYLKKKWEIVKNNNKIITDNFCNEQLSWIQLLQR